MKLHEISDDVMSRMKPVKVVLDVLDDEELKEHKEDLELFAEVVNRQSKYPYTVEKNGSVAMPVYSMNTSTYAASKSGAVVPFELGYPNLNLSVSVAKRTGNQQSKHWQVFTVGPERNSANIMEPFATLKEASAHFMKLFKKVNDEA